MQSVQKSKIVSYRDLDAWKKAMALVEQIYRITTRFPEEERFGLTSQMRRAAVSVPSNIAEGYYRTGRKEYQKFVRYSFGSGAELETQLTIARNLKFISEADFNAVEVLLKDVMKILNGLSRSLDS